MPLKAHNPFSDPEAVQVVLHYTGADDDRGGVMSVLRALADAGQFECVLGVNPGFRQRRRPALPVFELPRIAGETIGLRSWWRARTVARHVRSWLQGGVGRIFHAHSRAGLLVTLALAGRGERRAVASVHCYGRHRWFYRYAARRLGDRMFWLSPAMKRHYGLAADDWGQCIPGCVPAGDLVGGTLRRPSSCSLRFGGVGAIVRWKGWHLVLEALAGLTADERAGLRFDHIGAPGSDAGSKAYARELMRRTEESGLNSIVRWLGERPGAAGFMREIDVLIVASDREPFSIAVLEALAAGVPVLAADSGGAPDLIVAGQAGWFFRSGDAADLARGLRELAGGDAWRGIAITPDLLRPFTAPVVANRWLEVYRGILRGANWRSR